MKPQRSVFNKSTRLRRGNKPVKEYGNNYNSQQKVYWSHNRRTQMKIKRKHVLLSQKQGFGNVQQLYNVSLPDYTIYTPIYLVWVSCHQPTVIMEKALRRGSFLTTRINIKPSPVRGGSALFASKNTSSPRQNKWSHKQPFQP